MFDQRTMNHEPYTVDAFGDAMFGERKSSEVFFRLHELQVISDTYTLFPKISNLKPWTQNPEIRNPKPQTLDHKPWAQHHKLSTLNPEL